MSRLADCSPHGFCSISGASIQVSRILSCLLPWLTVTSSPSLVVTTWNKAFPVKPLSVNEARAVNNTATERAFVNVDSFITVTASYC